MDPLTRVQISALALPYFSSFSKRRKVRRVKRRKVGRTPKENAITMKKDKIESEKLEGASLVAPRGTRDFLFEEKILRDEVTDKLRSVFERYGFSPFETPAFEKWEVLSSKYAGGAEILKEAYRFKDQGKRELGLRYDFTVPLCRIIASNPSLALPVKRYAIGTVWRDGPIKLGRYREFVQCDVDTVGCKSGVADAEIVSLLCDAFTSLGIQYVVKVNNRKLLEGLLESLGVKEGNTEAVILSIDKLAKVGRQAVKGELIEKGLSIPVSEKIVGTIMELSELDAENVLAKCEKLIGKNAKAKQGLTELEEVFDFIEGFEKDGNVTIDVSLARGLAYYTGTIIEVYCRNSEITSSIAGGGRYDELIGKFAGRESIPAVGVSFGLDVICEVLKLQGQKGKRKTVVDLFVIPIKTIPQCIAVCGAFRAAGVNTSIDLMSRSISKNLEYASKQGIRFAAIVGPKEAEAKKLTLRNLETGEEKFVDIDDAIAVVSRSS